MLDLTPAQLRLALSGAHPKTMAGVNARARAWARRLGYTTAKGWTVADLVLAGLAVRTLRASRPERGLFRWVDEKTGALL